MKELIEKVMKELNNVDYQMHIEFITGIMGASKERLEKERIELNERSNKFQSAANDLNEYINKTFK